MVYDCLLGLYTGFTNGTERFLAWSGMESGNAFRAIEKDEPTTHPRLPTMFLVTEDQAWRRSSGGE